MRHICRICLKEATALNFVAFKTNESYSRIKMQLSICVPEMVVDLVKDPVFCISCVSSLHSAYSFKILCLRTEELIKYRKVLHSKIMNIEELLYDLQQSTDNSETENTKREHFAVSPNMNLSLPDEILENGQDFNTQSNTGQHSVTFPIDAPSKFDNENGFSTSAIQNTAVQLNSLLDNPFPITTIQPQVFKQEGEDENEDITIKEEDIALPKVESSLSYEEGFEDKAESEDHTAEAMSMDNKSAILQTNTVSQNCFVKLTKLPDDIVNKHNRFICKICKFTTGTKYYLKKHELIHDEAKGFSCRWCKFHTVQKDSLILHLRIHTGEKPFACNVCPYRAALNSNLQRHLRTHTGERPFACNVCTFRSAQKSCLQTHLQIHTGEKPFACNVCTYRSAQKACLQKHMQIHTGERPFACNVCSYRSIQKIHLDKHLQIHTGENLSRNLCNSKISHGPHFRRHRKMYRYNSDKNTS